MVVQKPSHLTLQSLANLTAKGFPYRSTQLRVSLTRVSQVMTLWSLTRVVWGIATLLVFVYNIELLQDSDTPVWSFVVLLLMFFVCEILPIIVLLDYSYLPLVGLERLDMRWADEQGETLTDPRTSTNMHSTTTASISSNSPARSVRWHDDSLGDPLLPPDPCPVQE